MSQFKILATLAVLSVTTCGLAARAEEGAAAPDDHAGHDHAGHEPHDHAGSNSAKAGANESVIAYLTRKSDEAFHQGDYDRVIGLNKAVLALDPSDVQAYGDIAWLLWSTERGEEAVQMIERGLKANPNDWEMWEEAGKHYDFQKKWSMSLTAYTRAVQLIPKEEDSQMVRRRLAHAAEKSGDLTTSVATWQALVTDFPNEPVNKNNLARVEKARDAAATATPAATDQ